MTDSFLKLEFIITKLKIWFENTFISPHAWEPVLQIIPIFICALHISEYILG